jgi:hypothetical protein
MNYSVDAPRNRSREAWTPSRRSTTWWQLHKTRGLPAFDARVTPVDPESFQAWNEVIVATVVEPNAQAIALNAQLHADAADRRVEVRWTEKVLGVPIRRRSLITLG